MVQLYAVVTKIGEVYIEWFAFLRSVATELEKNVLSADTESGGVQTDSACVPQFVSISDNFDDAPYFGGAGTSDNRCSLGVLSLPMIIVVVIVEIKWREFRILSGYDCVCSHG